MNDSDFSYSTEQAARLLGVAPQTLRAAASAAGHYRGIRPRKPAGRLMWPRSEVLAQTDFQPVGPRASADVRATAPWLAERGIPTSDPVGHAVMLALCDPRHRATDLPGTRVDDYHALRSWGDAMCSREAAAASLMSPAMRRDLTRAKARAVARIVAELPEEELAAAVAEYLGGALE